ALAAAASLHPTTTLWLAAWLVIATFVSEPRSRVPLGVAALMAPLLVWAAAAFGPLAGRLSIMDAEWLAALADKEYLFPLGWPPGAWLANLAYVPLIFFIYRH